MYKIKIYYEDTDSAGVVYYANYLKFLERARTQILLDNGFTHTLLREKYDIFTVVKSCNVNFLKPAKLDEEIEICTSLIKKSKVQFTLNQKIYSNNILLVEALIKIAIISLEGKITRMPIDLYNVF